MKTLRPDHPDTAWSRTHLARILEAEGRYEEAEVEQRLTLAVTEKALGPDHYEAGRDRRDLSELLLKRGRRAEALALAEQAWQRHQRSDISPDERAATAFVLARVLWSIEGPLRDRARARSLAEDAASSYRASEGDVVALLAKVEQWQREHRL